MPDPGDAPEEDDDVSAAIRTVRLAAAAVLALAVGVAALAVGSLFDDDDGGGSSPAGGAVVPEPDASIGPRRGVEVEAYRAERSAALDAADGVVTAVVSFTSYREATFVAGFVPDISDALTVRALLVAAPGGAPTFVAGTDLAAWASAERAAVEAERAEIAALLPTVEEGSEFIPFYEDELRRFDALLAGLDPAGEVVFAAVVEGSGPALRRLAQRPEIRLVDPGTGGFDLDESYAGLRPEELDVTGSPPQRPR